MHPKGLLGYFKFHPHPSCSRAGAGAATRGRARVLRFGGRGETPEVRRRERAACSARGRRAGHLIYALKRHAWWPVVPSAPERWWQTCWIPVRGSSGLEASPAGRVLGPRHRGQPRRREFVPVPLAGGDIPLGTPDGPLAFLGMATHLENSDGSIRVGPFLPGPLPPSTARSTPVGLREHMRWGCVCEGVRGTLGCDIRDISVTQVGPECMDSSDPPASASYC